MIDVNRETLLRLKQAAKRLPGNVHISTVYRWIKLGVNGGTKLEAVKMGGQLYTSEEAMQRFGNALTTPEGETDVRPDPRTTAAEAELARLGM